MKTAIYNVYLNSEQTEKFEQLLKQFGSDIEVEFIDFVQA